MGVVGKAMMLLHKSDVIKLRDAITLRVGPVFFMVLLYPDECLEGCGTAS